MEIHLSDQANPTQVVRSQDGQIKVIFSINSNYSEVLTHLQDELSKDEYQTFINLYRNDLHPRSYTKAGDYLIIKNQIES